MKYRLFGKDGVTDKEYQRLIQMGEIKLIKRNYSQEF